MQHNYTNKYKGIRTQRYHGFLFRGAAEQWFLSTHIKDSFSFSFLNAQYRDKIWSMKDWGLFPANSNILLHECIRSLYTLLFLLGF